jgi:hypothetical protein
MKTVSICLALATTLFLTACGHNDAPTANNCQPRPSDTRVQTALGGAVGNFGVVLDGVEVGSDCTTGMVVFHMLTDATIHEKQLISTDNGKWFIVNIVGLGDVQLLEIKQ